MSNGQPGLDQSLNFSIDSSGADPSDVQSRAGGKSVDRIGWYHCIITDVKNDTPTDKVGLQCLLFECQVVGAGKDVQEQIGRYVYHRVYLQSWLDAAKQNPGPLSDGSRNLVLRFALGIGLIRQEQIGQQINIPWAAAMDRQFCCTVEEEEYEKDDGSIKKTYKIPFNNVFGVLSDEFAHHIVVNAHNNQYVQLVRAAAGQQVQGGQMQQPAQAPQPQQPQPQPAQFGPPPGQALPASPAQPQFQGTAPNPLAPIGSSAMQPQQPAQAPPQQQAPFGQPTQQIPGQQQPPQQPQQPPQDF